MTDVSEQRRLALPRKPMVVDIATVRRMPSLTRAINLCSELAGLENDKDQARAIDIDATTWSLIKKGERAFPQDKYELMFDEFGNEAPLIWLADRRGYSLTPLETELQRQLRVAHEEKEELRKENLILRGLFHGKAV